MRAPPPHEMVHEGTDATGMEEWRCPECGRHFIVRWPPDWERLVLVEGDPDATHVGSKGDVSMPSLQISPAPDPSTATDEDAWRRWLRENGIDWDGWVA